MRALDINHSIFLFLNILWMQILFSDSSPYLLVKEVCFDGVKENSSVTFSFQSQRTMERVTFPVNYQLVETRYSYDNLTWYSINWNDNSRNITVDLYALVFEIVFQSSNSSNISCVNVTAQISINSKLPELFFNSINHQLIEEKELTLFVNGQHASEPFCSFSNKSVVIPITRKQIHIQDKLVRAEYVLSISKRNIYPKLCQICIGNSCNFSVTCEASYPGNVNNTTADFSIQTTINTSELKITSKISTTNEAIISGNILDNKCKAIVAHVTSPAKVDILPLTGNNFTFNITIKSCSSNNLSIQTYSSSNLTSAKLINVHVLAQPDFSNITTSLTTASSINVSWIHVSCVHSFSMVQVEWKINQAHKYENNSYSLKNKWWIVLPNLAAMTLYNIRIRFQSESMFSEWSQVLEISTSKVPTIPGPLITKSLDRNGLRLLWNYTGSNNVSFIVIVTSYKPYDLSYKAQNKNYHTALKEIKDTSFTISLSTIYNISIFASNHKYTSKPLLTQIITSSNVSKAGLSPSKPVVLKKSSTTIELRLQEVLNANAPVTFYDVIVNKGETFDPKSNNFVSYSESVKKHQSYYIALRISSFQGNKDVVIGDKSTKDNFTNVALQPSKAYTVFVRFGSMWQNNLQFSPYNSDKLVAFKTDAKDAKKESSLSTEVKAAIIVSAIVAVFLAFFIWVCYQVRKHRHAESTDSSKDYNTTLPRKTSAGVSAGRHNMGFEMDNLANSTSVMGYSPLKYEVDNIHKPIPVSDFLAYVGQVKSNYDVQNQFKQLNDGKEYDCQHGKDQVNTSRNRYEDIIPYDHNRYLLDSDKKMSDYINASLISSYTKRDAYIATQGPLPSTFNDFWRMIWESESKTVVMLGKRIENGIIKYALYWPTAVNIEMKYGKVLAKMKGYEKFGSYGITTILLYKKSQAKQRTVKLFHFSAWPDREAPNKIEDILSFRRAVNNHQNDHKGPVVIHCSAGVGRTGAFIAIDAILENIRRSQTVDIYNFVNYLRTRRVYMVQTQDQYQFIHDAISTYLLSQSSAVQIDKRNIGSIVDELSKVDTKTNCDGFTKSFKEINRLSPAPQLSKENEGSKEEHLHKNRYPERVPYDSYRVKVLVAGLTINETYINATKVNTRLISTQAPLEATCKDFWLMVYDSAIKNIVMLNNRQEGSEIFPDYFSIAETTSHGPLRVTVISEISPIECVIKREMVLKHEDAINDEFIISHYQILNWPSDGIPDSMASVIYVVNELQRSNASEPTVVHCNDGFGRSGCLIACSICVERLDENDQVGVDDIVSMLRERNDAFIDTVDDYEFIYRFLKEYLTVRYSGIVYI